MKLIIKVIISTILLFLLFGNKNKAE